MSEKKPTGLDLLRVPFESNQISKLPKPTKKREEMDKLPKGKCDVCGGYHATSNVIHLDYVGHAALTDRLLDADPHWNWEPLALTAEGLPVIDRDGGMWIKLTVCGITRLGYGDAQGKTGGDAMKERIGDALRNAAMRFGAALDLWHKGDLHADEDKPEPEKSTKEKCRDLLVEIYGEDYSGGLLALTAFTKDGKNVPGKSDLDKINPPALPVLLGKLRDLKKEMEAANAK